MQKKKIPRSSFAGERLLGNFTLRITLFMAITFFGGIAIYIPLDKEINHHNEYTLRDKNGRSVNDDAAQRIRSKAKELRDEYASRRERLKETTWPEWVEWYKDRYAMPHVPISLDRQHEDMGRAHRDMALAAQGVDMTRYFGDYDYREAHWPSIISLIAPPGERWLWAASLLLAALPLFAVSFRQRGLNPYCWWIRFREIRRENRDDYERSQRLLERLADMSDPFRPSLGVVEESQGVMQPLRIELFPSYDLTNRVSEHYWPGRAVSDPGRCTAIFWAKKGDAVVRILCPSAEQLRVLFTDTVYRWCSENMGPVNPRTHLGNTLVQLRLAKDALQSHPVLDEIVLDTERPLPERSMVEIAGIPIREGLLIATSLRHEKTGATEVIAPTGYFKLLGTELDHIAGTRMPMPAIAGLLAEPRVESRARYIH